MKNTDTDRFLVELSSTSFITDEIACYSIHHTKGRKSLNITYMYEGRRKRATIVCDGSETGIENFNADIEKVKDAMREQLGIESNVKTANGTKLQLLDMKLWDMELSPPLWNENLNND
jgi:hypothetical protein